MAQQVSPRGGDLEDIAESGAKILRLQYQPRFEFMSHGAGVATRLGKAERIESLEFTNVSYSRNGNQKLFSVSGQTRPGEVLTIMGPSLAGKTKLLAILAGAVHSSPSTKQTLTGDFVANGKPMFQVLRAGFVARSDAIFQTATVEEELVFNTQLRLPVDVSAQDRATLVEDLITSLGLTASRKVTVNKLKPVEKKKLAIAIELCACPNALFVDEPTSRLDAFGAWEVMHDLHGLASSKSCIVVCAIQNPPSAVFESLSHVLLLGKGHLLFSGPASDMEMAFRSVNLVCPPRYNPADFALLCASVLPLEELPKQEKGVNSGAIGHRHEVTETEVQLFQHRPRHRSSLFELKHLLIRELRATKRDPKILIGRIVSTLIVMALCACVFLHVGDELNPGYFVGSHFASFVFPLFSGCFGTMVPTVLYIFETKPTFVRERAVNVYGTMPYLVARLIPELVINFLISVLTVLIMYWAAAWKGSFILLVVVFYLLLLTCISWSYLLAFAVSNVGAAVGLVALVMVPQLLFMGTFVRISALPVWLQWPSYLCNVTYALRLIGVWEFAPENTQDPKTKLIWTALTGGNNFNSSDVWWYIVVLLAFFVVLRMVAFLVIRRKIATAKRFGEL